MSATLAPPTDDPTHIPSGRRLARAPAWVPHDEWATVADMLMATGLTYRRLDYWTRLGYLRSIGDAPGSGYRRVWLGSEQRIGEAMERLTALGVHVDLAAQIARRAVEEGVMECQHRGVTIRLMVTA